MKLLIHIEFPDCITQAEINRKIFEKLQEVPFARNIKVLSGPQVEELYVD